METRIEKKVLNETENAENSKFSKEETENLVKKLRISLLQLLSKYLREEDGTADYVALSRSEEFKDFRIISQFLPRCDIQALNEAEKKTFFINVYNILTMDAICEYHKGLKEGESMKSPLDIPLFWRKFGYNIGGHFFCLDDIEHGILRCNVAHPTSQDVMFNPTDPRLKHALTQLDPRIHFALNCGAKSCPGVRVYSANNLDEMLDNVTRGYLRQEVNIDKSSDGKSIVVLPQILQWYRQDFGSSEREVLKWLTKYTEGPLRERLSVLCRSQEKESLTTRYCYDWTLNQTT